MKPLFVLFLLVSASMIFGFGSKEEKKTVSPPEEINIPKVFWGEQFIAGWNLGNSLDVHHASLRGASVREVETYWNNPLTSEALIREIRKAGFTAIRIPVTWYQHFDKDYNVDSNWFRRVQQVVDFCIQNGLIVILNAHHENWYDPSNENIDKALVILEALWKQIGTRFADYDERLLLFEGMNEPRLRNGPNEWTAGTREAWANVNRLNETFIKTIRNLGGINARRYLLVPTYCARHEEGAITGLYTAFFDDRVLVSIHLYQPFDFTHNQNGTRSWNPDKSADTWELDRAFEIIDRHLIKKGIPVVITEFGALDKRNEADRIAWARYVIGKAESLGIPLFWWDDGGPRNALSRGYSLINRHTRGWLFTGIVSLLTSNPE